MIIESKIAIFLSICFLIIRIYYGSKLENKRESNVSILGKILGGTYGGSVIFPIVKKGNSLKERRIIKNANIAVSLFWVLFLIAMILILI